MSDSGSLGDGEGVGKLHEQQCSPMRSAVGSGDIAMHIRHPFKAAERGDEDGKEDG